jgi:myo-inositol-1(or 4)-monophosphatase
MTFETELALAVEAALAAGAHLHQTSADPPEVLSSTRRDIKLQADRDSERIVLDALKDSPHPVLAEESGEHGAWDAGDPFWVVDPLDGTMNYSRGLPACCVSIALCRGDEPLLGVIHDFNRDETFTGVPGQGAWLNGESMRHSGLTDAREAILGTGFPVKRDYEEESLKRFVTFARQFKKVRMLGSAALMAAYVACGRTDAYIEDDIMLWDVAAGLALVKAVGGWVSVEPSPRGQWCRMVRCAATPHLWDF